MAKILSIGLDGRLLETRHKILERIGAEVFSSAPGPAFRLLEERRFDLLLVCHTLTPTEILNLFSFVEGCSPQTQIVVLERFGYPVPDWKGVRSLDPQRGPSALLNLLAELLETPAAPRQERSPVYLTAKAA